MESWLGCAEWLGRLARVPENLFLFPRVTRGPVCFPSASFPSWTSRVRSPSPALLFSVTYFFLSAFFTRQTVLNDVAVMLSASKYFPSVRLCTPECQRGTLAFVSASFEKWKASREVASTDSKL